MQIEKLIEKHTIRSGTCLIWCGSRDRQGYGKLRYNGKTWLFHRLMWTLKNGEIPKGKVIMHECNINPCGEYEHLRLGTYSENVQAAVRDGLWATGQVSGRAKLSNLQIKRILELKGFATGTEAAKQFGVTHQQIYGIWNGKTRRYG